MYFDERKKTYEENLTMRLACIIILFLISSTVAQTSITFGGYLQDLGNFLTTSYTTDTNTFLVGVIAGGLVLLQAPLIVIYKIIAEIISIVALSLFINFLGERMGFGSFIPFIRDALPRDDSSISSLPIDNLVIDENVSVRSYVDKKYLVRVYPEGHEIKTVRTFQETENGDESHQFVDGRRNHRKMNSRRRNNWSRWRRGRSDSDFSNTEINNSSPQNRNVPTESRHYFVHTNEQTRPPNGGNHNGGNHNGGYPNGRNPNDRNSNSGNPIGGNANSKNSLFANKEQNSVKSENKIFGNKFLSQISDAGNYFIKDRVKTLVNKVLESDTVKTIKNSLTKNISNFILKSIIGS